MTSEAPERIWINPGLPGWVDDGPFPDLYDVEYIRADHALALSAAAMAHPEDAQAALEARDKRVREEALREVLAKEDSCGFVNRDDILALIEGDTDER